MPIIPNAEGAIIDNQKLSGYVLSQTHPQGKHKARVFEAVLGLTEADSYILRDALEAAVQSQEAVIVGEDEYGIRYQIDFEMTTDAGHAEIRSGWMIRADEDRPRFVTCYVK
jgi:hypothetical protein